MVWRLQEEIHAAAWLCLVGVSLTRRRSLGKGNQFKMGEKSHLFQQNLFCLQTGCSFEHMLIFFSFPTFIFLDKG